MRALIPLVWVSTLTDVALTGVTPAEDACLEASTDLKLTGLPRMGLDVAADLLL